MIATSDLHLAAKLDPLGLTHSELPADLTPAYHGFSDADLDRPIWLCGVLGLEQGFEYIIPDAAWRPVVPSPATKAVISR